MWKSFLQSIALLGVAMLLALYSTAVARSGDIAAAALSALGSLGIAAWVGVKLVPRLARGVDWGWIPALSQYKVTRDGGVFFGALVVVTSAAVNTSNNLLYMVLSALLAVLALSGVLSAANFKQLNFELILPRRLFARERFPVSIRASNRKLLFPAFSLSAEAPGGDFYFTWIPAGGAIARTGEAEFPRRGRQTFTSLKTASRFPFGFFARFRQFPVEAECLCYPEILPPDALDIAAADVVGQHQLPRRGPGSDLHSIRDYVPSDSARHVHWKASARTGTLKTREFALEDSRRVLLAFDRYGAGGDAERFEALVRRAASLAFHLEQSGAEVCLVSDEWETPEGSAEVRLDETLTYLALVEMSASAPVPDVEAESGALRLSLRPS